MWGENKIHFWVLGYERKTWGGRSYLWTQLFMDLNFPSIIHTNYVIRCWANFEALWNSFCPLQHGNDKAVQELSEVLVILSIGGSQVGIRATMIEQKLNFIEFITMYQVLIWTLYRINWFNAMASWEKCFNYSRKLRNLPAIPLGCRQPSGTQPGAHRLAGRESYIHLYQTQMPLCWSLWV